MFQSSIRNTYSRHHQVTPVLHRSSKPRRSRWARRSKRVRGRIGLGEAESQVRAWGPCTRLIVASRHIPSGLTGRPHHPGVESRRRSSTQPIPRSLAGVHECQHMDGGVRGSFDDHEHDEMRKAADRMGAAHVVSFAEDRKAQGCIEDVTHPLAHLGNELPAQITIGALLSSRGLVELGLSLRLDVEPGHRLASLASMRSKTKSAGLPRDSPARTRAARRPISSLQARASSSRDSLGAIASTTTRRSSSESCAASSMTC
jgi:hypothetical protein